MPVVIAFVLGILVTGLIMYIVHLRDTIKRQQTMIIDLENEVRELLASKSESDAVH
ncbi:hypothetical protein PRECH8_08240 [Insulibacter thermoxylanivorax]|uniref:Uncharacterized protein n=1 Tax=Insulibacter thermoxylanivorax TaxID=2749268 RepID=A0A916QDR4_9BACL|nr:hypothetical protein [Insulibacter thermoxylanivorax]GFR37528.1 hypothetical protein PRECH8_08240 [Insulibacter thermoxylanivorax]